MTVRHILVVAASLLLASVLGGCNDDPAIKQAKQNIQSRAEQNQAQLYLDSMKVACRDGREYLVGTGFRDNVVTATGRACY